MPEKMSRRKLLRKGSEAIVAGGVGACAAAVAGAVPATAAVAAPAAAKGVDYYEKLGLIPFINAGGTYTILSASTMPDEVQAAVALAESAPLLLTPGRRCQNGRPVPVDRSDWKQYVSALVDVGKLAHKLSQARNYDAFIEISEKLNDACANCHKVYRDKGGSEGSGTTRCQ